MAGILLRVCLIRCLPTTIVLLGLLFGATSAALAIQDVNGHCTNDAATKTTVCTINNPIVTQNMTAYDGAVHPEIFEAISNNPRQRRFGIQLPGIALQPGDSVTVDADGCVQTGGEGQTWKRYVNPEGRNADRLYHGTLGVINAIRPDGTTTPNPVRIEDVLLHRWQPFWIPAAQPLRLGYEDDNYIDNGYWGHDNGNFNQCNLDGSHGFGGNAFVTVTIQHDNPRPLPQEVARSVLTQHNDSMRTGAYLVEKQLTPDLVDPKTGPGMALRYSRPVDGELWAQLLYAPRVPTLFGERDVIYAFTTNNTVFAYDANEERGSGTMRGLIWSTTLPVTPHPTLRTPIDLYSGRGTPVIDRSRRTLFVVYGISNGLPPGGGKGDGTTLNGKFTAYEVEFHLAALDIRSGTVLPGRDIVIGGSVPSSAPPGTVDFVARRQTQRAGLLLAPNPVERGRWTVYVAFASRWHEESHNYHGWVMGYDAETFAPRGVFCSTPDRRENSEGGGIWQGGAGLAADEAGNVYFNTGNGPGSGSNHGNSIVKLSPVRRASGSYDFDVAAFSAADDDPAHLDAWEGDISMTPDPPSLGGIYVSGHDIDLGGGGVTVIPDTSQLVSGGKTGVLYLIDRTTMTKLNSIDAFDNLYLPCPATGPSSCSRYCCDNSGPHLHGAPTYWQVSPDKGLVFHWSEKDHLKRFDHDRLSGQLIAASALSGDVLAEGKYDATNDWVMPGGLISLSSNGTGNGLLWITLPWQESGRVFAFDALSLRRLWDITLPDGVHPSHNNPPTVADGRVIVGTRQGEFLVYGLARGVPSVYEPRSILPNPGIDPNPWIQELLGRLSPQEAAAIVPPQGHRPLSLALGSGELTYEARLTRRGASVDWVLVGVSGDLRDESGVNPHIAYAGLGAVLATVEQGLTWTAPDGTQMTWSVEKSVNAPQAGNASWVLFRSSAGSAPNNVVGSIGSDIAPGTPLQPVHSGSVLGAVTYVQQMGTEGGAPPKTRAHIGDRVDVPFTATYAFYVAETDNGNDSSHAN